MKNLWRNKRQCVIIFREWDRFVLLAWFTDANFCVSSLKKHTIIDAESLDLALNRYPLLSHFSFFAVRAANSFQDSIVYFFCTFERIFKQCMAGFSVNGTQTLYISVWWCPNKKRVLRVIYEVWGIQTVGLLGRPEVRQPSSLTIVCWLFSSDASYPQKFQIFSFS